MVSRPNPVSPWRSQELKMVFTFVNNYRKLKGLFCNRWKWCNTQLSVPGNHHGSNPCSSVYILFMAVFALCQHSGVVTKAHQTKNIFCLMLYRKYLLSLLLEKYFTAFWNCQGAGKLAMETAMHMLLGVSCNTAEAVVFMELRKIT